MAEKLAPKQTRDEIETDVTELEMEDDAFESKIRKLERDAERLLNHSNELLQSLNKGTSKQGKTKQEDNELKDMGVDS